MEVIKLEHVNRSFKDGDITIQALKDTNFSATKGEFVAIIGPSGSGKSTFLTIVGGLQNPSSGNVFINQKNIAKFSEKQLSKVRFNEIGFILQASNLVPFLTVEKQLEFIDRVKKEPVNRKKIDQLFEELGITHLKKKYPGEISGGEKQRVAIAKALFNDPQIIMADEPTASLDTKKAFDVVEILQRETKQKNKVTIMVTHDIRMTERCDTIYEMKDGVLKKSEAS